MTSGTMLQHRYTEIAPVIIAIGIVFRDAQQSRVTKARIIANMNLFSIFFVYLVKVTLDDSYQSGPHVANSSKKFHMDLTFEVCEVPLSFHSVDIL